MASLRGHHILSIIGEQGTGKTTVATRLCQVIGAQHIEASGVVAELHNFPPRAEMHKTNARTAFDPEWLGNAIAERIEEKKVVISGIREQEVHDTLIKLKANLKIAALWAPEQERFIRVKREGKCESYREFVQHGEKEMSIGLRKILRQNEKAAPPTFITSSFISVDEIVELMQDQLGRTWKTPKGQVI